ncbi:MAG: S8 family serine peptidase [Methanobacteriota archaeon]
MTVLLAALLLAAAADALAGGAGPDARAFAVVAVIDTGIRPAEVEYTDAGLVDDPASYVTAYPDDATPIGTELSDAVRGRLYYIPETRVVGAISFGDHRTESSCQGSLLRPIYDDCGHGNAVSRILLEASPEILLVHVEVGNVGEQGEVDGLSLGLAWAAAQPWIDVISISWQTFAGLPLGVADLAEATRTATDAGKVVVVAAGNGLTGRGQAPDRSATWTSPIAGPSWTLTVGAVRDCSGRDYAWHGIPVDVAARSPIGGGTSYAAPVVSGAAGRVIAAARGFSADFGEGARGGALVLVPSGFPQPASGPLSDGRLERRELEAALEKTAAYPNAALTSPEHCSDGVEGTAGLADWTQPATGTVAESPFEGFGVVDASTAAAAYEVVVGARAMPERPAEETLASGGDAARDAMWAGPVDLCSATCET